MGPPLVHLSIELHRGGESEVHRQHTHAYGHNVLPKRGDIIMYIGTTEVAYTDGDESVRTL